MPYIKNPAGRLIAIDDPKDYAEWLEKKGFSKPTQEEVDHFVELRTAQINAQKDAEKEVNELRLYLATVTGGPDGYGICAQHLTEELLLKNVNVQRYYVNQKVGILFHNPYSINRIETPYRMIYTMFESDKLPPDWRDYLLAADKVLVPSEWCAKTFRRAGVEPTVVPLGYNHRKFTFVEREPKRVNRKNFTFLHYNAFNLRKGFLEVLKAFVKAFDKAEPVRMIFKTTLENIPLSLPPKQYPNIEIINGRTNDDKLLDIIKRSDAFVFPSRGEGFGIPPLECMATGMPAIVPNAHGITEYFNPDYMYEAKVAETCPGIYSRYKGIDTGKMVVCDVDQLAQQMRWVYEHEDEARAKGKAASEYVKNWTFENTAKKLIPLIEEGNKLAKERNRLKNTLVLEKV